jgi:hypothetical protein
MSETYQPHRFTQWKDNEFSYCRELIAKRGDKNVGRDPKSVAAYLRLQAAGAFRDGELEISARLGYAATCINEDARNNHAPDWQRAEGAMSLPGSATPIVECGPLLMPAPCETARQDMERATGPGYCVNTMPGLHTPKRDT